MSALTGQEGQRTVSFLRLNFIGFYKNLHFQEIQFKTELLPSHPKNQISGMTKEQKILYIAFHNKKGGNSKSGATLEFQKFWGTKMIGGT